MRTLSGPGLSALTGSALGMVLLVEMGLSSTIRLATCGIDLSWGGNTWLGGRMLGVDPIRSQGGEVQGLRFSLTGVPSDALALALAEQVQGKPCTVYTAVLSSDTQEILDVLLAWSGTLDQMPISHGVDTSTVSVTAEHRGITFARPRPLRYTDTDQKRLFPGDRSMEFLVSQSNHPDIWPAASFFKK